MKDLKERTIRGGFTKVCIQAAVFIIRLGSLMVLGRLLEPKDFGLVGMVTAVIGVLNLFRDFGLSTATIQRATITEEQISTLFWINLLVGAVLGLLAVAIAPLVATFYHEPRLLAVTVVLAAGFLFNAAGVQHAAVLQRQMRFTISAMIDLLSWLVSAAIGIGMALRGYGYWSLVGMALASPAVLTLGVCLAAKWIPGRPRRNVGVGSMMRFGGTVTLNMLVVYIAYNLEKVLLGRFWGADVVGIYGRAYQLINIPTENLNSSAGGVVFAALSRVQDDPNRFKSYFLKAYSLLLGLTIPTTIACAIFADELIFVVLGPKWSAAVPIFRALAPTILIFAMINPFGWLLFSLGLVGRSLKVALVIAPVVITGYVLGLPYGPRGVAIGYSAAMTLWLVPNIVWCIHGTMISVRDILVTVRRPLMSGLVAAVLPTALELFFGHLLSPLLRLILGCTVFLSVYLGMLLYVMGEKAFYMDVLRGLKKKASVEVAASVSVSDGV